MSNPSQVFEGSAILHQIGIKCFAWNPKKDGLFATGSLEGRLTIWNLEQIDASVEKNVGEKERKAKIDSLDWKSDGSELAVGIYDAIQKTGFVQIYDLKGDLKFTTIKTNQINYLKWNHGVNFLLVGGFKFCHVWDLEKKKKHTFPFHESKKNIAEWISSEKFAVSDEKKINVYSVELNQIFKSFDDHSNTITSIKWNPTKKWLASGSADCTVKVWSLDQNNALLTLEGHGKCVNDVSWLSTVSGTVNNTMLASCSDDKKVRLWDAKTGDSIHVLSSPSKLRSLDFSPDGKFIASGSFIWFTQSGAILKTNPSSSEIKTIEWNRCRGCKLAELTVDSKLSIFNSKEFQITPKVKRSNSKKEGVKEQHGKISEVKNRKRKMEAQQSKLAEALKKVTEENEELREKLNKFQGATGTSLDYALGFQPADFKVTNFTKSPQWEKLVGRLKAEKEKFPAYFQLQKLLGDIDALGVRVCDRFNRGENCSTNWHVITKPTRKLSIHCCSLCAEGLGLVCGHTLLHCPWIKEETWKKVKEPVSGIE